ncbi:MAG: hypothetical protein QM820_31935 [Minicystis sp.]
MLTTALAAMIDADFDNNSTIRFRSQTSEEDRRRRDHVPTASISLVSARARTVTEVPRSSQEPRSCSEEEGDAPRLLVPTALTATESTRLRGIIASETPRGQAGFGRLA